MGAHEQAKEEIIGFELRFFANYGAILIDKSLKS